MCNPPFCICIFTNARSSSIASDSWDPATREKALIYLGFFSFIGPTTCVVFPADIVLRLLTFM